MTKRRDHRLQPIWAVVPGRMGSERLPGKTMATLAGKPSLWHIIHRLKRVPSLDGVVVATTAQPEDDVIADCARATGVPVCRGSTEDVLGRTLAAARQVQAETIVTVTGDCPLTDPAIVERVIREYVEQRPDYASNRLHGYQYPIGMDVEVFPTLLLAEIDLAARAPRDREHVTLHFYENPDRYLLHSVVPDDQHRRPELRLTIDTAQDLKLMSAVYDALFLADPVFGLDCVLAYLDANPALKQLNSAVVQRMP